MEKKNLLNIILTAILVAIVFGGGYYFNKKIDFGSLNPDNSNIKVETNSPDGNVTVSAEPVANINSKNSKMKIEILKQGEGEVAKNGDKITVNYVGTLTNGTKFDSSIDRGQPFSFILGRGDVIKGWDQGVLGMKVGEKRKLTIPSDLAYGERDMGIIKPNSTLIFEVDLLKIN